MIGLSRTTSWFSTKVRACSGQSHTQDSAFCEVAESVAVVQVTQTPAQGEIKRTDRIVRPRVCFSEPIVDCPFAVPAFTDGIRFEAGTSAQGAQFLNRADHPAAVTLDHVVAESIEPNFFQEPASIVDKLGVNQRRAMTKVRHLAESGAVPGFVLARMKTLPVPEEFAAFRGEFGPARLAVDGIQFLSVSAAITIEYQVGVYL
jgi:hypothetical protein